MAIALPILQFARHFLPFQGGASSIVKEIVLLVAGSGADLAERPHPSHFVRRKTGMEDRTREEPARSHTFGVNCERS